MAKCPECGERLYPDEYMEEGDTIVCPLCEEEVEVVSAKPFKVRKLINHDNSTYSEQSNEEENYNYEE